MERIKCLDMIVWVCGTSVRCCQPQSCILGWCLTHCCNRKFVFNNILWRLIFDSFILIYFAICKSKNPPIISIPNQKMIRCHEDMLAIIKMDGNASLSHFPVFLSSFCCKDDFSTFICFYFCIFHCISCVLIYVLKPVRLKDTWETSQNHFKDKDI